MVNIIKLNIKIKKLIKYKIIKYKVKDTTYCGVFHVMA